MLSRIVSTGLLLAALGAAGGCDDDSKARPAVPDGGDAGDLSGYLDSGADGLDAGEPSPSFGGLSVDTPAAQQTLDLFGKPGHRLWFEVNQTELARMNARSGGPGIPEFPLQKEGHPPLAPAYKPGSVADVAIPGDPPPGPGGGLDGGIVDPDQNGGDPYHPGGAEEQATYADHVLVKDVVTGSVADYGKLEVRLVGESTGRDWTPQTIPNLRIDADEFQEKLRIGGFEHVRLNNGQVGSIFREHLAHRVFRALGYPALRSSFVFVGSNVWGKDTWIPVTLMEVYKRRFCEDNQDVLGGTCENMWEFPGDPAGGDVPANACQVSSCDDTRLHELSEAVMNAPQGAGFGAALADIVDWPLYHAHQCIGWILATGDDSVRAGNNNLIIERTEDHKLIWAPYSVDISAGQNWFQETTLLGSVAVARGCQADPACWTDAYAVCEDLVNKFDALNPETFVDQTVAMLTQLGMMRDKDDQRATFIRHWYETRQAYLKETLPRFRHLPDANGLCPDALLACNDGTCGTEEECAERQCEAGQQWCETSQGCMFPGEECPVCEGERPLFCPPSYECVTDVPACSEQCRLQNQPSWVWCPSQQSCTPDWSCEDAESDGGVKPEPDAGGLDAAVDLDGGSEA